MATRTAKNGGLGIIYLKSANLEYKPLNKNTVINFVLFQLGWFACVLGAAKQMPWVGVGFFVIFLMWHLSQAKPAKPELILVLIAVLIGGVFDQIMTQLNLLSYKSHTIDALPPAWILALWAEFAMTLNVCLRWMRNEQLRWRWLIAVLFGAIGGPLAYIAALRLGAVSLNVAPMTHIVLAIGWGIITPLLLALAEKFDGFKTQHLTQ